MQRRDLEGRDRKVKTPKFKKKKKNFFHQGHRQCTLYSVHGPSLCTLCNQALCLSQRWTNLLVNYNVHCKLELYESTECEECREDKPVGATGISSFSCSPQNYLPFPETRPSWKVRMKISRSNSTQLKATGKATAGSHKRHENTQIRHNLPSNKSRSLYTELERYKNHFEVQVIALPPK